MKSLSRLFLLALAAAAFASTASAQESGAAVAQDTDAAVVRDTGDDAADVLLAIGEQWEANQQSDSDWTERMLADNFMGWGKDAPAPRSKSSTGNWTRFSEQLGQMIQHELYPLSVVIDENVAVVHYLYTSAFKDTAGKVEVSNGRYTDVLIRSEDGWKFIAWHGGDDED